MPPLKKKYEAGEGARYVSRKAALKYLQLDLPTFRKLCILKGIYPREPKNRKRAQKGVPGIKTLYQKKDIQFLFHEPVIWKLREMKKHNKRIKTARSLKNFEKVNVLSNNKPILTLDNIIKERYPTFIDALRDLDDCLTMCFLFSTFPSLKHVPREQSALCRRLSIEFLHAVIACKALRKVFVSIKGYYYQAEIKGQTITWIVPHHFCYKTPGYKEVDFKIMSTFVEFYVNLLGSVNFKLYHSLNLYYPPKFDGYSNDKSENLISNEETYVSERIAALNVNLTRTIDVSSIDEDELLDDFPLAENPEQVEQIKIKAEKTKKLKSLFKGYKFFLNREVPREPLIFIIRCFGGEVSWDKEVFVGATFDENDESINYHIIDRPSQDKQFLSRDYIQPQWVFDSVNNCELMPVEKYFIGVILPPHLSPFFDENKNEQYIPPEALEPKNTTLETENESSSDEEIEEEEVSQKDETESNINGELLKDEMADSDYSEMSEDDDDEDEDDVPDEETKKIKKEKRKQMSVSAGVVFKEDPKQKIIENKQEYRLREKMVTRKHRNLYKSMMKGRADRSKEKWLLGKKRKNFEENEKKQRKLKKKSDNLIIDE